MTNNCSKDPFTERLVCELSLIVVGQIVKIFHQFSLYSY